MTMTLNQFGRHLDRCRKHRVHMSEFLDAEFDERAMALTLNPVKRHRERCHDAREQLSEYLDGELDQETAVRVERHIRWCPNCGRMFANLSRTTGGLRALRDFPKP